jgi:hypothetical protein
MLTLGKQEWIVIPDGVKNGKSDATAVNLSFSSFSSQRMLFFIVAFRQPLLGDCCLFFSRLEAGFGWGWVAMFHAPPLSGM